VKQKTILKASLEELKKTGKTFIPIKDIDKAISESIQETEKRKQKTLEKMSNKKLSLRRLADITDKELVITYFPRLQIFNCELEDGFVRTKENNILISAYGKSDTIERAMQNYVNLIKGKALVFYPDTKNQRKYEIPEKLQV